MYNNSYSNDHDLLIMQDRLMDRISAIDAEIADEFKRFTRIYRRRLLEGHHKINFNSNRVFKMEIA